MRVLVAGAGPAGLGSAIGLKAVDKSLDITVRERRHETDLPGWGVALNPNRRFFLLTQTPVTSIVGSDFTLDGELLGKLESFRFLAVSRAHLLRDLRSVCKAMKIELAYDSPVSDAGLKEYDLVIAADGAGSTLRNPLAREFELEITPGKSYYLWLGVRTDIRALRADIRTTASGPFMLISYPYDGDHCTAIVIGLPDSLARSGFAEMPFDDLKCRLSEIFSEELHGQPLLGTETSQWKRFETVVTARAMHENLLLIGDALHTAHFSYGAGTRMALDDALAVAKVFSDVRDLGARFGELFWERRRDKIRGFQALAADTGQTLDRALEAASRGDREAVIRAGHDYLSHFLIVHDEQDS